MGRTTERQILPRELIEAVGASSANEAVLIVVQGERIDTQLAVRSAPLLIGRSETCELRLTDPRASRRHCEVWCHQGRVWVRDLGATNRTLVNGHPISIAQIKPGDDVYVAGSVLRLAAKNSVEARHHYDLSQLATVDELTGVLNRRKFMQLLEAEIARASHTRRQLALALIDLDHFKKINDTFGHTAGDEVLRATGAILQRELRREDLVGRIGGEEFALAVRDATAQTIFELSERCRAAIASIRYLPDGRSLTVTASVGVALSTRDGGVLADMLCEADQQLYRAKALGRDRICMPE